MAEFVIHNIATHWMDRPSKSNPGMTGYERNNAIIDSDYTLSFGQKIERKEELNREYSAREQLGDIVEARRNGGPRGKKEEECFIFLQVLSISLKDAKEYCVPLVNPIIVDRPIRRRKYFIDISGLIPDSHKNVSLTESAFNSRLKMKK